MNGERLRALRRQAGHSQESLAEAVNIGQRQIWRYENGQNEPDGATVAKIARVLGTSTDYLLGLSDDPTPYTMTDDNLSTVERAALAAWRHGNHLEAIRLIVLESNQ